MIKDKITPEIRERFKEEIKLTRERGKERGFLLCLDVKRGLYPSISCEGTECSIRLSDIIPGTKGSCVGEIQGNFHTHPVLSGRDARDLPSQEEIKKRTINVVKKMHEEEGIKGISSPQTPSYGDVLRKLFENCQKRSKGTVCIGTDADDTKVECWTPKKMPKKEFKKICDKTEDELTEYYITSPKRLILKSWIIPLFDREIINLDSNKKI